jgi:prolyl oligopeptidase
LLVRDGVQGHDRVLIDPAHGVPDGARSLDWWEPCDDGSLVAYGVSEGGSERSSLRVREVATGRDLDLQIPGTRACSLAWLPDRSGFYYTRYPEPGSVPADEESYHRRVFLHRLGRDWREDPLVFGEGRAKEDWPGVQLSPDGRFLLVTVAVGWTRSDLYLADLRRGGGWQTLVEGRDAVYGALVHDDELLVLTNEGAPRYRVLAADPVSPLRAEWRELIAESDDVIEGVLRVGGTLLVQRLREASSRLALHERDGRLRREVELPTLGSLAGLAGEWDGVEAFVGFSSFGVPPRVLRLALPDGEAETWDAAEAAIDPADFRLRLEHFASKDGTRVSIFLLDRHDRTGDGGGAALLTGYGGFGVSHTPVFGRGLLAFLEAGGLYAVAHLRGGGEYGEAWHRAGMLGAKQNVFDDFLAAAEFLVAQGHAAPERLAIMGGSNGGLLVGAALTQRPELFRAAVCQVPLLDMLRYHRFRIARLWIPEYGCADDPEAFGWLYAYSPYHRVRDGVGYPAVLLTTGEGDSRVDPLHARKMAARLQRATASGRPVHLRVERRGGHGQGKPIALALEEWLDVWCFVFSELGLRPR